MPNRRRTDTQNRDAELPSLPVLWVVSHEDTRMLNTSRFLNIEAQYFYFGVRSRNVVAGRYRLRTCVGTRKSRRCICTQSNTHASHWWRCQFASKIERRVSSRWCPLPARHSKESILGNTNNGFDFLVVIKSLNAQLCRVVCVRSLERPEGRLT